MKGTLCPGICRPVPIGIPYGDEGAEMPIASIVHGELAASEALRRRVASELGWLAVAPILNETVRLDRME